MTRSLSRNCAICAKKRRLPFNSRPAYMCFCVNRAPRRPRAASNVEFLSCPKLPFSPALITHLFKVFFEPMEHSIKVPRSEINNSSLAQNIKTLSITKNNPKGSTNTDLALRTLQGKYQELRDRVICVICLDNVMNMVFLCGHGSCQMCGDR